MYAHRLKISTQVLTTQHFIFNECDPDKAPHRNVGSAYSPAEDQGLLQVKAQNNTEGGPLRLCCSCRAGGTHGPACPSGLAGAAASQSHEGHSGRPPVLPPGRVPVGPGSLCAWPASQGTASPGAGRGERHQGHGEVRTVEPGQGSPQTATYRLTLERSPGCFKPVFSLSDGRCCPPPGRLKVQYCGLPFQ